MSRIVKRLVLAVSSRKARSLMLKMTIGTMMAVSPLATASSHASEGPRYAGIVVDANNGHVLYSENADTLHYPASLTKMMTLYLAFEALEAGKIKLDTPVPFSRNASGQAPTKLGVRAGDTITVEQAILGMVTLSANDAAMALGEFLGGGSEDAFARIMNNKARALGMTRTTYRNPNGLPNTAQMTTARDQARLGIALREHFPQYFGYFSTHSFTFRGRYIGNHNHLLGSVKGVDGIKTGYTRAAGFNLVTSLQLDGRSIVGVVLGGASTPARDNQMRRLIAAYLPKASVRNRSDLVARVMPTQQPDTEAAAVRLADAARIKPQRGIAGLDREPVPNSPVAAFAAVTPSVNPLLAEKPRRRMSNQEVASLTPTAPAPRAVLDPVVTNSTAPRAKPHLVKLSEQTLPKGWVVQVGVSPSQDAADALLESVKRRNGAALRQAKPYAMAVNTGGAQIYRARFAGFGDQRAAVNACNSLKKSGVKCWASAE